MSYTKADFEKIDKLVKYHNDLYFKQNTQKISDVQYDKLYNARLKILKEHPDWGTNDFGSDLSENSRNKVKHVYKELSLGKAHNENDLKKFYSMWNSNNELFKTDKFIIENKEDGLSIICYFNDPTMSSNFVAVTRGGGVEGNDVTESIRNLNGFKQIIKNVGDRHLIVRGECVINDNDFEKINEARGENEKFKNSRNTASGAVLSIDGKIANERKVHYYTYNIENAEELPEFKNELTELGMLKFLKDNGFETTDVIGEFDFEDFDKLIDKILNFSEEERYSVGRAIDGLVVKPNNMKNREAIGFDSDFHHPLNSIAFKFEAEETTAVLGEVIWNESGNGKLTPVGILKASVDLLGTEVNRASLASVDNINKRDLMINDVVVIRRSNDVIPQITNSIKGKRDGTQKKIEIPENTYFKKNTLYVKSRSDNGKIYSLSKAVGRGLLNIDGMSWNTIKTLHENQLIDIDDLSSLWKIDKEKFLSVKGLGLKKYETIEKCLKDAKNVGLFKILLSLQINNFGGNFADLISKKIVDLSPYLHKENGIEKLKNELIQLVNETKGFGQSSVLTIQNDLFNDYNLKQLLALDEIGVSLKNIEETKNTLNSNLDGLKFAITGKTEIKRSNLTKLIEEASGEVAGSINKNTNYLVTNTPESDSNKNKKAKELGTKIITEAELLKMIGDEEL